MKTVLKLFNQTFTRIPAIQSSIPKLSQNLRKTRSIPQLDRRARLLHLSNLILTEVSELQKETPLEVITRFSRCYDQIRYDYRGKQFVLKRYLDKGKAQLRVKSVFVEQFDHPFFRDSLYFHEITNADKYYDIEPAKGFPKSMQDLIRKSLVESLLDKKNPLGVPEWAQPLNLSVKLSNQSSSCLFFLRSHLGSTTLKKCAHTRDQSEPPFPFNPKIFDKELQKTLFELLKQKAGITPSEIEQMNKLKFIGGCVEKIELMMNTFQDISVGTIEQNQQKQNSQQV